MQMPPLTNAENRSFSNVAAVPSVEVKVLIHIKTESCGSLADKTIVESGMVLPVNFHQYY